MAKWIEGFKRIVPSGLFKAMYYGYGKARYVIDPSYRKRTIYFDGRPVHEFKLDDLTMKMQLRKENGFVDVEIFNKHVFEPGVLRLIKSLLTPDSVFFDIGANIGQHSLFAANYCRHVYAFEPIRKIYEQFLMSIWENAFVSISVFNYALGNSNATFPIYSNKENRGGSSLLVADERTFLQNVKVLRLDDIYNKMGVTRIDVMKIDVEGFEYEVLLGAEKTLDKFHPAIVIEFSPCLYNISDATLSQKIINFIGARGYTIYDIGIDAHKKELLNDTIVNELIATSAQSNFLCLYETR